MVNTAPCDFCFFGRNTLYHSVAVFTSFFVNYLLYYNSYGKPLLIGGHNISAFRALQHVKKGDTVVITTNYGVYKYEITGTKVADHRDKKAYDLSQEKEKLILYTCYPFNKLGLTSKRYFVYADKVSGPRIVSAPAV